MELAILDTSILDRHEKAALCVSGGKDSIACLYLLRDHLDKLTVYSLDTGDLLPEIRDVVSTVEPMCPNFVRVQGNVRAWIKDHGMPTDLLPYSAHWIGEWTGQAKAKLVSRYECCFTNLMWPLFNRVKEDGNTLCIRGTKNCDLKRLPVVSGTVTDGVELWFPLADWSHDDVFRYLKSVDAPVSTLYDTKVNAPECARCTAWWDEGRAAYLKTRHPDLYREYVAGLRIVAAEIAGPMAELTRELA